MSQKTKNVIHMTLLVFSLMLNFFLIKEKVMSEETKDTLPNNDILGYNPYTTFSGIKNNGYIPNPEYSPEWKKKINDSTTITYLIDEYKLRDGSAKFEIQQKIVIVEFEKFDVDDLQKFIQQQGGYVKTTLHPNEDGVYLFGITDEKYLSYFGKYGYWQGKGILEIKYHVPFLLFTLDPSYVEEVPEVE